MSETTPILLYGHLRAKFGRRFDFAVETPSEAMNALCTMIPGFREHMDKHKASPFRVLVGQSQEGIGEGALKARTGRKAIKFVPVVAGAGHGGLGKILVGAVLIAAGAAINYFSSGSLSFLGNQLITAGAMYAIGGAIQLVSPQPQLTPPEAPRGLDERPFYAFNGPHMTTGQGNPVPVLLGGPLRIGGALVSMGISTEQWADKGLGGKAPDNNGTRGGNGDTEPWLWAVGPA